MTSIQNIRKALEWLQGMFGPESHRSRRFFQFRLMHMEQKQNQLEPLLAIHTLITHRHKLNFEITKQHPP